MLLDVFPLDAHWQESKNVPHFLPACFEFPQPKVLSPSVCRKLTENYSCDLGKIIDKGNARKILLTYLLCILIEETLTDAKKTGNKWYNVDVSS